MASTSFQQRAQRATTATKCRSVTSLTRKRHRPLYLTPSAVYISTAALKTYFPWNRRNTQSGAPISVSRARYLPHRLNSHHHQRHQCPHRAISSSSSQAGAAGDAGDALVDLAARGFVADTTKGQVSISEHMQHPRTVYLGIDPTADGLHLGNLVTLMALRRLQKHGHRPVCLVS